MREAIDETRVLSILEVRLGMQILGVEDWNYFPVLEEEDSLEKRVMTAFLRLVDMGFMEGTEGGYRKTEQLEQLFAEAKHPEFTLQILKKNAMPVVITGNRKRVIVLEQMMVQDGTVRVYHTESERIWEYLETIPENPEQVRKVTEILAEKRMTGADVILRLRKSKQERMMYIWDTTDGKVYLEGNEKQIKTLSKEEFLQLLEE